VPLRRQRVLAAEEVREITALYKAGCSLRQLERQFKVSDGTVRNYLLRAGEPLRPARRLPR
jgi:transposase